MLVAFNFKCPGQMMKFHEFLMACGYTSPGVRLDRLQDEDYTALRIDTEHKTINGKSSIGYPIDGNRYGCTIITIDGKQPDEPS